MCYSYILIIFTNYTIMKLIIQMIDKSTFDVTVPNDGTVQDIKNQISVTKNHPIDQMKIIYNGSILDNAKKLSEYNLTDETKIVVLLQKAKVITKESVKQPIQNDDDVDDVDDDVDNDDDVDETAQPTINQIVGMLQQNPQALMQLLMADPIIQQVAQQNPNFLAQLINDPNFINNLVHEEHIEGDEEYVEEDQTNGVYEKFFEGEIILTDNQKQEVNDIVAMGFPFEDVIPFYVACDHNKEQAINALFKEKFGD